MILATANLYRQAYAGLSRRIWLLSLVMLINRSGTMVLAFMTLYCYHMGFTIKQGGLVVAIYGIGSLAGGYIGGIITDRFNFYYTQFFALLCGGLLFILLGQMRSYTTICTCTFFLSMVNESFRPANAAAIAHYSTVENRTKSFSLVRLAINLGWGIGSALGGFLASINYNLLFWVDGATNITASFLLLLLLPKVTTHHLRNITTETERAAGGQSPYKDKLFLYFLLFSLLFAASFFQLFTTVPLYFKSVLHLDEFWIGAVMAVNGIIIALFEMVIVFKLEGRHTYLKLMFFGTILMAVSFLILNLTMVQGLAIAFISTVVITIAEMVSMPFMNSFYIERTTQKNRGSYAGLYTMTWSAAQVIGSSAGTFIAYKLGFFNLWVLVFLTCIIAAFGYYSLHKKASRTS